MTPEAFGFHLEEQLRHLPPAAQALLKDAAVTVEERCEADPGRAFEWKPVAFEGFHHLMLYWKPPPAESPSPIPMLVLFRKPIVESGFEPGDAIFHALLHAIESRAGLDPGALDPGDDDREPLSEAEEAEFEAAAAHVDGTARTADLEQIAEDEIAALTGEERDWFDTLEIAVIDFPEAEGAPDRVADYPEPEDDPAVLAMYERNIRRQTDPPEDVVRRILKTALQRRETPR